MTDRQTGACVRFRTLTLLGTSAAVVAAAAMALSAQGGAGSQILGCVKNSGDIKVAAMGPADPARSCCGGTSRAFREFRGPSAQSDPLG
jgi:hypothetical protein